jgi:diguanylate cyclase (GGDEF)-like protein
MIESLRMSSNGDNARMASLIAALEVDIDLVTRHGEPLTLVIAGIDRMAGDDREGRLNGDPMGRVLQVVAGVLREDDASVRRGPDEFAILLPGADRLAAAMVCQRMDGVVRAGLRELAGIEVSFSFGVAEHSKGMSPQQMVSAAEADLATARAAAHAA